MSNAMFFLLSCSLGETLVALMPLLPLVYGVVFLHVVASRRGWIFKLCSVAAVALFTPGWRLDTPGPLPHMVHQLGMRAYQNAVLGIADVVGGDSALRYLSQSPAGGHHFREGFDRILASDAAYSVFAGGCWMALVLAGFVAVWLIRRARAAVIMASKIRGPSDRQSKSVDALMFFVLGEELGADYQYERVEMFEKRYRFNPSAAHRDYSRRTFGDLKELVNFKIERLVSGGHSRARVPRW